MTNLSAQEEFWLNCRYPLYIDTADTTILYSLIEKELVVKKKDWYNREIFLLTEKGERLKEKIKRERL